MAPDSPPGACDEPPDPSEIALTDADILEAMREIPGYLDITTADFRAVYHLAHRHALDRLLQGVTAGRLMRREIRPLTPQTELTQAIPLFTTQALKALPVVDARRRVLGILTETNALRAFGAETILELIGRLAADHSPLAPAPLHRAVGDLMTAPAVCVPLHADLHAVFAAFSRHPGRTMPVVSADGKLAGLLARKDFQILWPGEVHE